MAVIFPRFFHLPFSSTLSPPPPPPSSSSSSSLHTLLPPSPSNGTRISCSASSSSSSTPNEGRKRLTEFPYVSPQQRDLMAELVSTVEKRLDSFLLPCTLPPDVQRYQNQTGTAQASLYIRSGLNTSPIDFILGSWLHCELPTGGELNITTLSAYLNSSTDAPNFVIEFIQSSPTSLILFLDLPPRKDLVLHPNYLQTFYEDTELDRRRQVLAELPEFRPYVSPSLYIRSFASPTGILARVDAQNGARLEEIVGGDVSGIAKEVLGVWLDVCACGVREVGESERACLAERDGVVKRKTIEVDLGTSLPRMFGTEVAARVLGAIQEVIDA